MPVKVVGNHFKKLLVLFRGILEHLRYLGKVGKFSMTFQGHHLGLALCNFCSVPLSS